jgi:hypothetical protein
MILAQDRTQARIAADLLVPVCDTIPRCPGQPRRGVGDRPTVRVGLGTAGRLRGSPRPSHPRGRRLVCAAAAADRTADVDRSAGGHGRRRGRCSGERYERRDGRRDRAGRGVSGAAGRLLRPHDPDATLSRCAAAFGARTHPDRGLRRMSRRPGLRRCPWRPLCGHARQHLPAPGARVPIPNRRVCATVLRTWRSAPMRQRWARSRGVPAAGITSARRSAPSLRAPTAGIRRSASVEGHRGEIRRRGGAPGGVAFRR